MVLGFVITMIIDRKLKGKKISLRGMFAIIKAEQIRYGEIETRGIIYL